MGVGTEPHRGFSRNHGQAGLATLCNIESELILSQAFPKRFGGYLEWDNYYAFGIDKYVQTLDVEPEFAVDREKRWTFAPYVVSAKSRLSDHRNQAEVDFDLTYAF